MIASWLPTLLLLPLFSAQAESPADSDAPAAHESLEGLLERARKEQTALIEELRPTLQALVAELEVERRPAPGKLAEIHAGLDQLGREAGLLLLEYLDPGAEPTKEIRFRAQQIKEALVRMHPGGIVGDLIRRSQSGSAEGRIFALELLGHVPEKERAGTHLRQVYRSSGPELRLTCIRSIARLGGPYANAVLQAALEDEAPGVRREVMRALAANAQDGAASAVYGALGNLEHAAPMAREIVSYYLALPAIADDSVIDALIELATHLSGDSDGCVPILRALPRFEAVTSSRKSREIRERIEPLVNAASPEVRDGALVCAVLLGDRKAKRALLEPYDGRIEEEPTYYKFYDLRGSILLQIEEYTDAAKDFGKALELIEYDSAPRHHELWINLARAQVLTRKFARARQTLVDMQMSYDERQSILQDPDFAEFVANPRYAKIFE